MEDALTEYIHQHVDGSAIDLPVGKAICVGRNYAGHAKEMGAEVPDEPILFLKPASSFRSLIDPIELPAFSQDVHHEVEMATLIESRLSNATPAEAQDAIGACGIGLDLTARDLQTALKNKGQPWERAKAFDGACPLSPFVDVAAFPDLQDVDIKLLVNGEVRQSGNTSDMVFPVADLIAHMSQFFTLQPGDVVLTGTPAGVGPLAADDVVLVELGPDHRFSTRVAG